jgi:hypothetical protein
MKYLASWREPLFWVRNQENSGRNSDVRGAFVCGVTMEALKAEMEARKARTNELKERSNAGKRKFIRRGELAAIEQQEVEEKREV